MKDQTDDKECGINIVVANESQTPNNSARAEICPVCKGKGIVLGFPKDQKCYKCNGTGKLSPIA